MWESVKRVDAILIAGPTASGKSRLAARLARDLGGVVVNADSMQVYGDLAILTARPTQAETAAAPHRLYGHVDAGQNHSVGRYLDDVRAFLAAEKGTAVPIFVGGTGLYFKALTEGLSQLPDVPPEIRAQLRAWAEGRPTQELHGRLGAADPAAAARLRPTDRLRVLRALEIMEASGRSILSFHGERSPGPLSRLNLASFFLAAERATVRAAIDRRFETMIAEGALDEVAALAARRLDPALPAMRAHGVPALLAHLKGEMRLGDAILRGQADTRAYAKRQFTWFRHQMPDFVALALDEAYEAILEACRRGPA